jgi:hypothetical protein
MTSDRQRRGATVVEFPSGRIMAGEAEAARRPRNSRRLADKILVAFHQACEEGEADIAEALLNCCEWAIAEGCGRCDGRADDERLMAAFERLWFLRHRAVQKAEDGRTEA